MTRACYKAPEKEDVILQAAFCYLCYFFFVHFPVIHLEMLLVDFMCRELLEYAKNGKKFHYTGLEIVSLLTNCES